MSHHPPHDDLDRVVRAMAEVEDEMARVGADWAGLDAAIAGPDAPDDAEAPLAGVDVLTLLAILRSLPDGAGTAAVIAALEGPPDAP